MATLAVSPPGEAELRNEVAECNSVVAFAIVDQRSYDQAADAVAVVAAKRRRVLEFFGPMKEHAFRAHREICAREAEMLKPITAAEAHLKAEIGRWSTEQERIRREIEEQQRRQQEADMALALESELEQAEASGASADEIQAMIEMPRPAPVAVAVAPTYESVRGISTQKRYRADVHDIRALCRAIGEGKVPVNYVTANTTALNAAARAAREMLAIPGVRVVVDVTTSVRTK